MNILGIIPAKSISHRFPGKNKLLFEDAAKSMLDSKKLSNVIVASDNESILKSAINIGCSTHNRAFNEVYENLPIIDVLKLVYLNQKHTFTHILCVFGCTVNVTVKAIIDICEKAKDIECQEIRSFDKQGNENGMFMLTTERLLEGHISSYLGCVINDLKEIHTKEQLNDT